jgi:hypothetical protein
MITLCNFLKNFISAVLLLYKIITTNPLITNLFKHYCIFGGEVVFDNAFQKA